MIVAAALWAFTAVLFVVIWSGLNLEAAVMVSCFWVLVSGKVTITALLHILRTRHQTPHPPLQPEPVSFAANRNHPPR